MFIDRLGDPERSRLQKLESRRVTSLCRGLTTWGTTLAGTPAEVSYAPVALANSSRYPS
jgi:hypothetical protein